mmetsp:Transcript_17434/g.39478  ORF Transcript_17434/g.39478 Transcript_17434/m.39478 type:complete len:179 (-) Transcript_17434:98-634(-)
MAAALAAAPRVVRDATGRPAPCFAGDPTRDRSMLLVACEINGLAVEMMIDSGAQTSVMSATLAQQLNLMGQLDRAGQGLAAGVGRDTIQGVLHSVPVRFGQLDIGVDFRVLGGDDGLLLLGIDQMRRFSCVVDLSQECLTFSGCGDVKVPFCSPMPTGLGAGPAFPQRPEGRAGCLVC